MTSARVILTTYSYRCEPRCTSHGRCVGVGTELRGPGSGRSPATFTNRIGTSRSRMAGSDMRRRSCPGAVRSSTFQFPAPLILDRTLLTKCENAVEIPVRHALVLLYRFAGMHDGGLNRCSSSPSTQNQGFPAGRGDSWPACRVPGTVEYCFRIRRDDCRVAAKLDVEIFRNVHIAFIASGDGLD